MTDTIPGSPAPRDLAEASAPTTPARRLPFGLHDPLLRNAYALMVSSAGSGALGLIYWVLANLRYQTADVGRAMAVIGAMRLLSAMTSFGFVGTLTRFVVDAGRATGRFIGTIYLLATSAAAAMTVGFLLTLDHWGDNYRTLAGFGPGLLFIGAVVIWVLFTLQDVALTGLRRATWVPVSTIGSSMVKIGLLYALATVLPTSGIVVSWVVAVALAVLPVNLLMFHRLVPRHGRETAHRTPPTLRTIRRFFVGDYLGSTFALATTYLLPVIVGVYVSATTYNYYYSSAMVGGIVETLAFTMATSLTVEGAFDRARLAENGRRALGRMLVVIGPIVLVAMVLAPLILAIFGSGHAANASTLLRLIMLATLPRAVIEIYLGMLRARSRARALAIVQAAMAVLAFAGTFVLLPRLGVTGVGVALLAAYLIVLAAITPMLVRGLTTPDSATALSFRQMMGSVNSFVERTAAAWRGLVEQMPGTRLNRPARSGDRAAVPGWPERVTGWVLALLSAEAFALYLVSMIGPPSALTGVDPERMNGLGLISVLPPGALGGVALQVVAFFVTLAQRRYRPVLLLGQLLGITFCLHGASALVSEQPRFPTAWLHAGFVEYIGATGELLPGLDARFSWAGFFALFAFVGGALGMDDFRQLMNWYPVAANLAYLVPLLLILRRMRADRRAKWLAAVLFVTVQWIGQDYFSPQGTTYLLYLLFLAIVVTWFGRVDVDAPATRPRSLLGRLGRHLGAAEPGEFPARPADPGTRVVLFLLLIVVSAAATASHQITPFMMAAAVLGLVIVRRCGLTTLPWLTGALAVGWISYLATPYWAGHLGDMFGAFGSIITNLSANTTARISASTGDPLHPLVLKIRLGFAGALALLAGIGLLRRLRRKVVDRVALVLTVTPVSAMAMQSYGGEMGLRVYFFLLPGACLLAAYAFFPNSPSTLKGLREVQGRPPLPVLLRAWLPLPLACLTVLGLAGGFYVARYGNEQFERVTSGEIAALDYIYARDTPTARVLMLTPMPGPAGTTTRDPAYSVVPWREKHVERVEWVGVSPPVDPTNIRPVIRALRELGPGSFLLAVRSQEKMIEVTDPLGDGFPENWGPRIRAALAASPDLVTLFASADAAVYALRVPPAGSVPPPPDLALTPPSMTAWTPLGLVAFGLFVGALVTAEVLALTRPSARRLRRNLIRASVVPMVVALAVVIERFSTLGM